MLTSRYDALWFPAASTRTKQVQSLIFFYLYFDGIFILVMKFIWNDLQHFRKRVTCVNPCRDGKMPRPGGFLSLPDPSGARSGLG